MLEEDIRDKFSIGEVAGEVITTVDDLNRRLEVYSAQLFRQARWEAQRFSSELLQNLPVERAVKSAEKAVVTANRIAATAERAASVVENAPKLIASEREATVKALQEELGRTINCFQQERIAALEHLTRERIAAIGQIEKTLVEERKEALREAEKISMKTVDHAMWRVAQLAAAIMAVLLLAAFAGLFLVRRMFFQASR